MNNHFIKNINIETFKCFNDFNASAFCHVNLIGGKNNIGKTALLEALYLSIYSSSVTSLASALCTLSARRKYPNNYEKNTPKYLKLKYLEEYRTLKIKINSTELIYFKNIKKELGEEFFFKTNSWESGISKNSFYKNMILKPQRDKGIITSPVRLGASNELNFFYRRIQEEDREEEVNKYIKEFDHSLNGFKFINQEPKIKKNGKYHNLSNFGDGLKSYIAIILAIYSCKNGILLIDEIENGIHYTQLNRLWEIIITTAKNANCQIFATTHSKECIEAYGSAAKKANNCDISFTTLVKDKQEKIHAITHNYDLFMNNLEQNHEVRGW